MSEADLVQRVLSAQTQEEFESTWYELKNFLYEANGKKCPDGLAAKLMSTYPALKEHIRPFWATYSAGRKTE